MAEPLDPNTFGEDQLCFACGPKNSIGLNLTFERDGQWVTTRWTPTVGYEGPPGIFHGGLQATVADDLAGWAIMALTGHMGFTTRLEARYHSPVRIGQEAVGRARIAKDLTRFVEVDTVLEQQGVTCFSASVTYAIPTVRTAERILGQKVEPHIAKLCRKDP